MSESKRKKVYELGEGTLVSNQSSDPVEQTLKLDEDLLVREYKTTRLQLATEKYRQELNALKGNPGVVQGGMGVAASSPATALIAMLASQGMEPDKANAYIKALDNESMMKLSVIGAQNKDAFLPLILLASKQGTSIEEIVKVVGAIIAIAKPSGEGGNMMTKLVTETIPNMYQQVAEAKDSAYQAQLAMLRQEIADIKPKSPMDYVKDVYEAATALGMRSGSEVSLEVRKMELEDAREVRRIKADSENTKAIIGTVKDIMGGKGGDIISRLGDAGVERIRSGKGAQPQGGIPPSTEMSNVLMVQCTKCGGTFKVSKDAEAVKCPHCGTELKVEYTQPSQTQTNQGGNQPQTPRVPDFGGGELAPVWSGPPEKE